MKTKLIPLTAVVLALNERDTIRRSLTSLSQFAEILLLDASTDNTVNIAQKIAGDRLRVIKTRSEDFSELRNMSLSESKYDWVLFVDADEEVSQELVQEIKEVINDERKNGFFIKRKDYFLGRWLKYGETGKTKLLKLGLKKSGKWRRRVHEVWDINGETSELRSPILHYPHPTIAEFLSRINRWTTMDAEEFYSQGARSDFGKIVVYPGAKFVLNYFIQRGFLDGMPGLIMALMMSFHSFLTRAKLYLLSRELSGTDSKI